MHLVSSSVKALSGLSFYLRHLAQRGNFLIIDEPELNLHPDNQRRVAKLLVRLARSGVKVMISTHSDYVIRELNNAIMLSADTTGELRRRYGYEPEDTLSPAHVGAYLFDTSRAHAVEVAPTGIEAATIDQQVNALNASSQDIYFSLFQDRPS
jgi:ABC-type multidrug transport system ATPase subunit